MLGLKVMRKSYVGSVAFPLEVYINMTIRDREDIIDVIGITGGYDKGFEVFYKVRETELESEGKNDPELDRLFEKD